MLYFIRHGQTNHNLNKLLAGTCDIPLNEEGLRQAKVSAEEASKLKIDLIMCSPLIRAKQTCEEINKYHNVKVIIKNELIERNFGIYESKTYSSIDGDRCWNYHDHFYDREIEPLECVFKRVNNVIEEIKNKYKGKNILIVAHNDIGRAIHCYFNGIPKDGNVRSIDMGNAQILGYEWRNENDKNDMGKSKK